MEDKYAFVPPRRLGTIFHIVMLLVLSTTGIWALWQAARVDIGAQFFIYLSILLLCVASLPLTAYRAYALRNALYTMERNGIQLRWGLRYEVIPIDKVIWVHREPDLSAPVPRPWLRWPGAVLGVRRLPGGDIIEFTAATTSNLVIIATEGKFYAISPQDPQGYLQAYQRFTEMGSLAPLPASAQHPTYLISQVWRTPAARNLILIGFVLCLILFGWSVSMIPTRDLVHMGFYPDGTPGALVPSIQLLLLPILCTLFYVVDLLLGLFFFRRQDTQPISYLLWGSGFILPILSIAALVFILNAA